MTSSTQIVNEDAASLSLSIRDALDAAHIDRIGVAVSGGGDSMALLLLLTRWSLANSVPLSAVTVDHGLRPEASDEAAFVARTCADLGVPHTTLEWDGRAADGNIQDAARRARYALMAEWAHTNAIDTIALGHTLDDQAETFFMRLARASGIDGLTGMQTHRDTLGVSWVRPLLSQKRDALRSYLVQNQQAWVDDPSNENEAFDRIKARKAMAALADLDIDAALVGRVMSQLSDVRHALDVATYQHARVCMHEDHGDLVFDPEKFSRGSREVNRRLASHALRWIASADYGPRGAKLHGFIIAIQNGRDATLHGVRLSHGKDGARLSREFGAVCEATSRCGDIWDQRWHVECKQNQGFIVRALGEDGLGQLGALDTSVLPRESLKATPAVFYGADLVCAPLAKGLADAANPAPIATARLIHPHDHAHTSLLSH